MADTVVDVTDAILKGSVKGPTFTGTVDGAKFTGSVTYADTMPPSGSNGVISNFSGNNGAEFQIGNNTVKADNADKNWSLQSPDDHTLRFEVRSHDCWRSTDGNWDDATMNNGAERSEISWSSQQYPAGVQVTMEYLLTLAAGSGNSSRWLVLTQSHATVEGPGPFGIELQEGNDRMQVKIRYRRGSSSTTERILFKDSVNMRRGHAYQIKFQIKFDPAGAGVLKVWRDGAQIVNYSGAIGYDGSKYYFKLGCYRDPAPETQSMLFSNIHHTSP